MTASLTRLGPADVRAAADRIADWIDHTPLLPLDVVPGVWLKAEHRQRSGSFKIRGAANALLGLGARTVVTGSSGNHGLALATIGQAGGVPVTVVMAAGASAAKAAALRRLGATVVSVAGGVAERDQHARALAERDGAVFVPSSDHELVAAGQGTVAVEAFADRPELTEIYVPTGGGGLLAGVCLAAADHPVRVIGVEPAAGRRYAQSLAAGQPVRVAPPETVADGLRGQQPGQLLLPIIRDRVDELLGVTDAEILAAQELLRANGVEAEPSGAVALAGALRRPRTGPAVVIVSGGNTAAALRTIRQERKHQP